MDDSTGSTARTTPTTADRVGLWLIRIGAVAVAVLHVAAIIAAGEILGDGPLEVGRVALAAPVTPAFTESLGAVTAAHYDSVTLTVDGAPPAARWLLWGAQTVTSFATIGICVALVWLCLRVARQRPFGRSVTLALSVTAGLVVAAGLGTQLLAAMGRAEVVDHLGGPVAAGTGEGFTGFAVELSLAPVGIALALAVVAAAFEIGARMQRDTEGLV